MLLSDFFRCADRLCVAVRFWKKQQKRISFSVEILTFVRGFSLISKSFRFTVGLSLLHPGL